MGLARSVISCWVLTLSLVVHSNGSPKDGPTGALVDYMYSPDPNYDFSVIDVVPQDGYTTYFLNMTSQQWYDENLSDRSIWWHYVTLHIPDDVSYEDAAFMYVGGSSNTRDPPTITTREVIKTGDMAEKWGFVTVLLELVPNQPITFLDESGPLNNSIERTEDGIIAWTWVRYVELEREGISQPELLLQMPMCKAVVQAMNTVQTFVEEQSGNEIQRFELGGESKRGWVTWLTGAIDERVAAMVPVVLSCLNMNTNFHHYWQSFGGWPYYMFNYWSQGVMDWLDEPEMELMEEHIDPYTYIEWMDMPVLMISATSDEFFLIDDSWYFFDDLPGDNNYFWALEDAGHWMSRNEQYDYYWESMGLFFVTVLDDFGRPDMSWSRYFTESGGMITLQINSEQPKEIQAYSAPSVVEDRRDWRLRILGVGSGEGEVELDTNITWTSAPVEDLGDGNYQVEYDDPEEGYLAFFINMVFDGPYGEELTFTTEAQIIPDGFPFDDCEGEACRGILV